MAKPSAVLKEASINHEHSRGASTQLAGATGAQTPPLLPPHPHPPLALHFAGYKFVRVHSTLRVTPAMEAGITDQGLDIGSIVESVSTLRIKSQDFFLDSR